MSFFSKNKIITINGSKNYFRFFVSSMPIFALLLLVINLFGFVISNEISFKLHDRDIASSMSISGALLETFGTESTLEQTVYKDQVKSIVRQFAKSSGVSCVELSWEGHSIMYPPQNLSFGEGT